MGNQNKKSEFHEENWEMISKMGPKTILRNNLTLSTIDMYQCDQKNDTNNAQALFEWHKSINSSLHITQLFHFEVEPTLLGATQYRVFTEHITRFSQLAAISKAQSFLILEQVIQTVPFLFHKFGLFHVNIFSIGVSDAGQTKVWVNENVAKNYPEQQDVIKTPSQNLQLVIVNNLVRMMKSKVFNNDAQPEYPFSMNFLQTLQYIRGVRQRLLEYQINKVFINRNQFNEFYKTVVERKQLEAPRIPNQTPINPANQSPFIKRLQNYHTVQEPDRQIMQTFQIPHQVQESRNNEANTRIMQMPMRRLSEVTSITEQQQRCAIINRPLSKAQRALSNGIQKGTSKNKQIVQPTRNSIMNSATSTNYRASPSRGEKEILKRGQRISQTGSPNITGMQPMQISRYIQVNSQQNMHRIAPQQVGHQYNGAKQRTSEFIPAKIIQNKRTSPPKSAQIEQKILVSMKNYKLEMNRGRPKDLSRIIELQDSQNYAQNVIKQSKATSNSQSQGFNIELVESIYMKDNDE